MQLPEATRPESAARPPENATPPVSRLRLLWLAEAVRQTEEHTGWLDDEQANLRAQARGRSFAERLQWRAWSLAGRDGLVAAQAAWLHSAGWAAAAVAALAVASGLGLAWAALGTTGAGGDAVVNVYQALGALLGLNLLTLLAWLAGVALVSRRRAPGGARLVGLPGRLFLSLNARLSRDARGAHLGPSLMAVLGRAGLSRWLLGIFSHAFWLLALATALAAVLLMLATRRYGFVWESTLLGQDSLVAWTAAIGALPAWLGFAVPDPAAVAASGQAVVPDAAVRQQWALWLIGVVLAYGLLPRALLLAICAGWWLHGLRQLRLDEDLPGYRLLRPRLMPSGEALGVSDAAPRAIEIAPLTAGAAEGQGAVLFAVELGLDHEWPPALPEGVAGDVHDGGRLDSGGQRQRALAQLQRAPAERLLVACDVRRSPDRGTLRLLVSLAQLARDARIWLLEPPGGQPADPLRPQDWRQALQEAGLRPAPPHALAWLERGDDAGAGARAVDE